MGYQQKIKRIPGDTIEAAHCDVHPCVSTVSEMETIANILQHHSLSWGDGVHHLMSFAAVKTCVSQGEITYHPTSQTQDTRATYSTKKKHAHRSTCHQEHLQRTTQTPNFSQYVTPRRQPHSPTPPLSHSPTSSSDRAVPRHLKEHLPKCLCQRTHVLALPPPRVVPEERLMQEPRLEEVLQRRVEETGVAEVDKSASRKINFRVPRVGRRPRSGWGVAAYGGSTAFGGTAAVRTSRSKGT